MSLLQQCYALTCYTVIKTAFAVLYIPVCFFNSKQLFHLCSSVVLMCYYESTHSLTYPNSYFCLVTVDRIVFVLPLNTQLLKVVGNVVSLHRSIVQDDVLCRVFTRVQEARLQVLMQLLKQREEQTNESNLKRLDRLWSVSSLVLSFFDVSSLYSCDV